MQNMHICEYKVFDDSIVSAFVYPARIIRVCNTFN
jgi:hypothetical protein